MILKLTSDNGSIIQNKRGKIHKFLQISDQNVHAVFVEQIET